MTIPAIPTRYNGRQYRSRLEARHAAFYDLLGFDFEYEPLDLNGWIPDFAIRGKETTLLVEVKPISEFDQQTFQKMRSASRWEQSWEQSTELLLVGAYLGQSTYCEDTITLGWLEENEQAVIGMWNGKYGLCSDLNSYRDRISEAYLGGRWGYANQDEIRSLWAEAGNIVQYKKPLNEDLPAGAKIVGKAQLIKLSEHLRESDSLISAEISMRAELRKIIHDQDKLIEDQDKLIEGIIRLLAAAGPAPSADPLEIPHFLRRFEFGPRKH